MVRPQRPPTEKGSARKVTAIGAMPSFDHVPPGTRMAKPRPVRLLTALVSLRMTGVIEDVPCDTGQSVPASTRPPDFRQFLPLNSGKCVGGFSAELPFVVVGSVASDRTFSSDNDLTTGTLACHNLTFNCCKCSLPADGPQASSGRERRVAGLPSFNAVATKNPGSLCDNRTCRLLFGRPHHRVRPAPPPCSSSLPKGQGQGQ